MEVKTKNHMNMLLDVMPNVKISIDGWIEFLKDDDEDLACFLYTVLGENIANICTVMEKNAETKLYILIEEGISATLELSMAIKEGLLPKLYEETKKTERWSYIKSRLGHNSREYAVSLEPTEAQLLREQADAAEERKEMDDHLHKLSASTPEMAGFFSTLDHYWEGKRLYVFSYAAIGSYIAEAFDTWNDKTRKEIFLLIEEGCNGLYDLQTAVKTGLLEDLYIDAQKREIWERVEPYLGLKSRIFIEAFIEYINS